MRLPLLSPSTHPASAPRFAPLVFHAVLRPNTFVPRAILRFSGPWGSSGPVCPGEHARQSCRYRGVCFWGSQVCRDLRARRACEHPKRSFQPPVSACFSKFAELWNRMERNANGWDRTRWDGAGRARSWPWTGSGVKVYLNNKTYD